MRAGGTVAGSAGSGECEMSRVSVYAVMACAALCVAFVMRATPAPADDLKCYERDVIVEVLEREFGEVQQRADLHDGPGLLEFFANPESGSWTILLTPDWSSSCVLESGYLPEPGSAA